MTGHDYASLVAGQRVDSSAGPPTIGMIGS